MCVLDEAINQHQQHNIWIEEEGKNIAYFFFSSFVVVIWLRERACASLCIKEKKN